MKSIRFAARIFIGLAVLACFFPSVISAGERGRVLHIYTWSDYFDSYVLHGFEIKFNCRVAVDYFDSNESMYAKLKAGGGGYDIITPSSYMSAVMNKQGMLEKLDHSRIANLDNTDRKFTSYTEDPDMAYSVPYTRTVTGVGYDANRVSEDSIGSWDIFANAAYSRRMTMLNDIREALGATLKYLGYSLNTTNQAELDKAGETLIAWKKNLAKFDVDEAKFGLGAGEFLVIQGYNGDVALIMEENPDIGFYIPKEGTSLASDDFVIARDSLNKDLAHEFINYLLDPEVAVANMESIRYYMPNPRAIGMLSEDLRENPAFNVPDEALEKCEVIRDLGASNILYARIWDRVKAAE